MTLKMLFSGSIFSPGASASGLLMVQLIAALKADIFSTCGLFLSTGRSASRA